jgi:molybdate transport system substrate-binding protein
MRRLLQFLFLFICLSCTKTEQTASITVSAAASLKDVLTEIGGKFPDKTISVQFQFAASGEIEKQIMGGAPVDVFISASSTQIERLQKNEMLINDTISKLATNRLIAITYQQSTLQEGSLSALLSGPETTKIAIGDPALVPAGEYAKKGLEALNLWDKISPRLVTAANVRQALDLVSRQEAEIGFVYETDIRNRSDVRKLAEFPAESVPVIVYPAAVVKKSPQLEASKKFLTFLQSAEAKEVFAKYGFGAP